MLIAQVPEVPRIEQVHCSLFAAAEDQVRSGNEGCAGGVEVHIRAVQLEVVGGREPVEQLEVGRELEKTLAEVVHTVPASIAGNDVDVALGVHRRSLTGLPDARLGACG